MQIYADQNHSTFDEILSWIFSATGDLWNRSSIFFNDVRIEWPETPSFSQANNNYE